MRKKKGGGDEKVEEAYDDPLSWWAPTVSVVLNKHQTKDIPIWIECFIFFHRFLSHLSLQGKRNRAEMKSERRVGGGCEIKWAFCMTTMRMW